jgi:hypothetical protein
MTLRLRDYLSGSQQLPRSLTIAAVKEQVFYRAPWTQDRVEFINQWWCHFGTGWVAEQTGMSRAQVKAKADRSELKMLPKAERLCVECLTRYQYARYAGLRCRECHLERRKNVRRGLPVSVSLKARKPRKSIYGTHRERWIALAINTTRYRSPLCDLTVQYMLDLWTQQEGRCYYSNLPLREPVYGTGRHPDAASIDRIDPTGGYVQRNVVWATWACNAAKNNLSIAEFVELCSLVVKTRMKSENLP